MLNLYLRAKIREKAREGTSVNELAREFEVHVCTIYRIIQEGEKKRKRRGRPLKLSAKERRKIVQTFQQNPLESARGLSKRLNKSVSPSTIRRLLRVHGYRHAPVKISVILKPETVEKRLDFVREHVRKEEEFWRRVIFTDEKKFNLVGNDATRLSAWTRDHQRYNISRIQPSQASLMVWGAISSTGTLQLVCTTEKINAQTYTEMLEDEFFHGDTYDLPANYVWMHDNAPAHRAKHTQEFLENKGISVLKWPPHSPDLNPIENVWGILEERVYTGGRSFSNTTDLWEVMCEEWKKIPTEMISNLYSSMHRRCCDVLLKNGQRIKY